jgi:alpha-amylase
MSYVCMYFQVHQPKRLRKYPYFDIGHNHFYEDDTVNRNVLLKVATNCYLPTNSLLLDLIKRYKGQFKVAFSLSGVIIEQFKRFSPETLDSFKRLIDTGYVELLNETYYHSLSYLFSEKEFKEEVKLHKQLMEQEFGHKTTTFRNTELLYNNDIAKCVEKLGYKTILTEGADKVLGWRSPNFVYQPPNCSKIKLLLKNYQLSDDIAFRFSESSWKEFPIDADKYAHWIHALHGNAHIINLFMDYETFGEHQWESTGIFEFLRHLPACIMKHPDFSFVTPSEACTLLSPIATLDIPMLISWADEERDLTAWKGNELQEDALNTVYALEKAVKATKDYQLIQTWRSLLTSDHFYYMCTKFAQDGDVHKYFSPYNNPYDAYINFQNIMSDFSTTVENRRKTRRSS